MEVTTNMLGGLIVWGISLPFMAIVLACALIGDWRAERNGNGKTLGKTPDQNTDESRR